ncbi:MAG: hypothetical protein N5P05_001823 [Chroococcopsis gigantea SAG 12.99]|jgi:hypothetical protein|nr:hypothetical protein [Chroococcopsis gigantea SAG 12.99]
MQCSYGNETLELSPDTRLAAFQAHFTGSMEMFSAKETVADYLNAHQGWFCRCAQPMKTEPFGDSGYILTVGKYGAFGYDVEPKMAVILDPPLDGVYNMRSVPIPDEPFAGYAVDYRAVMGLEDLPKHQAAEKVFQKQGLTCPELLTKVSWDLKLIVKVSFPQFIYKLPQTIIQSTGDRLLSQIIRQVSPRLTYKVQQDFHQGQSLPLPPKTSRHLLKVDETPELVA